MSSAATFLVIALLAPAVDSPASKAQSLTIDHCVVSLIDEAQVPAKRAGVIGKLAVSEGTEVQAGQLLGQLDDAEVRIAQVIAEREHAAAKKEAANDINVRYSVAAAGVAKAEVEAAIEVNAKVPGTVAAAEVRRLRLAQHRAELGIEQAEQQFEVAKITATVREAHVDAARLEVVGRQVVSPLNGQVVRLVRHEGEWVNIGDAICHVVRLDRLRVTGFVNVAQFDQAQVQGRSVTVQVKLASGKTESFAGKIGFASPLVQPGGEYRVWADIENREHDGFWVLRPGLTAKMEVALTP
jgi:multidrug efflux pump subunit AcrA (membrane-fusion protein)